MSLFAPDGTRRAYYELHPEDLTSIGVKLLILDVDNTLAPYEQPDPDGTVKEWLAALKEAGITAAILSNNHGERIERFNAPLALPYRERAHKPLTKKAKKLIKELGFTKKETAFIGDQIFTDMLCAHLTGARGFLVPPIKDRTDAGTRLKRYFERGILRRYHKKHPEAPDVREGSLIVYKGENT